MFPTSLISYVDSGVGTSSSASPDDGGVFVIPYGGGAIWNNSCHVSVAAGSVTTVWAGMMTVAPLRMTRPPDRGSFGSFTDAC